MSYRRGMAASGDGGAQADDASPSVERRFIRAALARRLFGTVAPVKIADYELLRPAGAGGMGLVFEARDSRTGQRVALKVLRGQGDVALQRLKREFRTLAELHHPHLVQLHQLSLDHDLPFMTMEFVSGVSVLQHVTADPALRGARLECCVAQLVDAVCALHRAGLVHRDLKHANVLVDACGRLVLLDFGLTCPTGEPAAPGGELAGTPLYLPPERVRRAPASPAEDWYGLGLLLADVLDVALPARADGRLDHPALIAALHAIRDPSTASWIELAIALLAEAPERRPDDDTLCKRFRILSTASDTSLRPVGSSEVFVGREHELELLHGSLARARAGAFVRVDIAGAPGIGKTALARHFLAQLAAQRDVMVLASRCYEREFLAYNAIDGVLDLLAHEIAQRSEHERAALPAEGLQELRRLFPALRRVLPEAKAASEHGSEREPQRVRHRAFSALRKLLLALAGERTIVIHLDDLQWGDADSGHVLSALLQAPAPSPLLLIASYRSEAQPSASLRALQQVSQETAVQAVSLELGALEPAPSRRLAAALCRAQVSGDDLAGLLDEAAGSPLFLRLLLAHRTRTLASPRAHGSRLQQLVLSTLQHLAPLARGLLELAALSGGPIGTCVLLRAASLLAPDSPWPEQLSSLQHLGLLRRVHAAGPAQVDVFHDRLREIVADAVSEQARRRACACLAEAALLEGSADQEFVALQFEAAGEFARAAQHAHAAGDCAFETLALERSVRCYTRALRCCQGARPPALLRKLANVSAYTGRSAEVATLFLELAERAGPTQARADRVRAAELLMRSNQVQQSVAVVAPLLRESGLQYPDSLEDARRAAAQSWARVGQPVSIPPGARRQATELECLRIDLGLGLGYRLAMIDPVRAAALLLQAVELALACGRDDQLARALACHAVMVATFDVGNEDEPARLIGRARALAAGVADPQAMAWVLLFRAVVAHTQTRFAQAYRCAQQARSWIVRHQLLDRGWFLLELDLGTSAQLAIRGDLIGLARLAPQAMQRAQEVGNAFQAAGLRSQGSFLHIGRGQAERVIVELGDVIAACKSSDSSQALITALWPMLHALLYIGDPCAALALWRAHYPRLKRAGFPHNAPWTSGFPTFYGTLALASARGPRRERYLCIVEAMVRRLQARGAFGRAIADLLGAGLARARADLPLAIQLYAAAVVAFDAQVLSTYAAVARMRQAELCEGERASELRLHAQRYFTEQGIVDPARWTRAFAPIADEPDARP